jgi:peptidyl-prolyl cis-trans isomerase SurA
MYKWHIACLVLTSFAPGEIVDRVSVVVAGHPIKSSDIVKDIRLTDFLNHEKPSYDLSERKKATARLIDQALIRKELTTGVYANPDEVDVDSLFRQLKQQFGSEAAYQRALVNYGITEMDLRSHLRWQLTVLRFIKMRFAAGIAVPVEDIRTYYQQHLKDLTRATDSQVDLNSLRPEIEQAITSERVNKEFFAWLDEAEKNARITYNEQALK